MAGGQYRFYFSVLQSDADAVGGAQCGAAAAADQPVEKRRRQNIDAALELVDLKDRAGHKPREMSGGQQQRVAIARAIVSDPKMLLCDEPTGDLDRQTANEILSMLQVLNRDHGKTIVMVTHDPEAAKYAQRILHLDKGQFVEQGAL